MFFSTYVLTQKGSLAKVWMAAHWEKKLTAKDVKVVDLKDSVLHIVQPSVPIALRTSGELMLGVVRIYALKVQHLLRDATEATQVLLKPRAINLVKVAPGDIKGAATDGGAASGGAANVDKAGKGAQELQTAVAITMDVTVGRLGAEQLLDADFADVADLLGGAAAGASGDAAKKPAGKKGKKGAADDADAAGKPGGDNEWWFATEASQTNEELQYASRHDAAMAKFKADLDKSTSGSKKGSSSTGAASSVEQARGAAGDADAAGGLDMLMGGNAGEEFLLGGESGNFNLNHVLDNAVNMPDDPFALTNEFGNQAQQQQQQQQGLEGGAPAAAAHDDDEEGAAKKKGAATKTKRMVIVMDAETSLRPDQLKRMQETTGDVMFPDRRRGPLDDSEAADRVVLRDENIIAEFTPLACYFTHDVLKAAFHTAVNAVAAERMSELQELRSAAGLSDKPGRMSVGVADEAADGKGGKGKKGAKGAAAAAEQPPAGLPFEDEFNNLGMPEMLDVKDEESPAQQAKKTRRRGRNASDEEGDEEQDGFSASTLDLLKVLRERLLAAGAKSTTTLRIIMDGKHPMAACRSFVDLLHLTSHQFVSVAQKEAFGAITVSRGPRFNAKV